MGRVAISVEGVSKSYRLGTINHGMLYKDLQSWWARFRGKDDPNAVINPDDDGTRVDAGGHFWALSDVSFSVKSGEVLGIVGRNGAGKSTLLKILARVTAPTKGLIRVRGRIASLLEVGTGFHPELTGRENIFLNGAILGMRKVEIATKLDEIVSFAEMGKFIDTPVKRYSSGMYVRLAFAVAAHLDPEILIIDEVLAVGDAEFQKKCLGKMDDVAKNQGRTVLFVSHNMGAVSSLCSRAVIINKGRLISQGETKGVIDEYLSLNTAGQIQDGNIEAPELRSALSSRSSLFKWKEIRLLNSKGAPCSEVKYGEPFQIVLRGYAEKSCSKVLVGLGVFSKLSGCVFATHQVRHNLSDTIRPGLTEYRITIDPNMLTPGIYDIQITAKGTQVMDDIPNAAELHVLNVGVTKGKVWDSTFEGGLVYYPCSWSVKTLKK